MTKEPKGYRDVYWCFVLNEPFIVEYRNDKKYCPNCNFEDFDLDSHQFIQHISKPMTKEPNKKCKCICHANTTGTVALKCEHCEPNKDIDCLHEFHCKCIEKDCELPHYGTCKLTQDLVNKTNENVNKLINSLGDTLEIICDCRCEDCFENMHCANTKCGPGPKSRTRSYCEDSIPINNFPASTVNFEIKGPKTLVLKEKFIQITGTGNMIYGLTQCGNIFVANGTIENPKWTKLDLPEQLK